MAYSVPKRWQHGNTVAAADLNKYSDGLNHIYAQVSKLEEFAVMAFGTYGVTAPGVPVELATVVSSQVHVWRWLVYKGAGKIFDNAGNSTTLPDATSGGTNIYDLDNVGWLSYGMTYYISGVEVCLEDWYA